jgi:stearoyl-CoA desaturase (delta-9 desaturase)
VISFFFTRNISPAENRFVSFFAFGEGWHNYHHAFPYDYKTSELGNYGLNFTTAIIDFFAWLGLAYDLKTVSQKVVYDRVHRTGDGTHPTKLDSNSEN